jgi:hypothetical protein
MTCTWTLTAVAAIALIACGGDDDGGSDDSTTDTYTGPLYAMMTQVYSPDDRDVYVSLTTSLDDFAGLDIGQAREYPGVANFTGVGGKLLVSSGQEPTITEYAVTDDLEWQDGRTISFASFPLDDNANFYYQFLLNDTTAILPYAFTKRVVWNPSEMTITGTFEDSSVAPTRDGLAIAGGGNRNAVRYSDAILQPFFYTDNDYATYAPTSVLAVYDPVTHLETKVVDLPCPGVSLATQDETGRTYISSWDSAIARALYGDAVAPCVTRVNADQTVDEAFTTDFTDITDGRYTNNFRYIGGGKGLANVLHHELIAGADFTAEYDPAVAETIGTSGPHWKLWLLDVENGTGKPVEGITVEFGSGAQFAVLDGRTFVFLPYADWGRSKVYEIGADGVAVERWDTAGDIFKWIRVR